MKFMQASGNIYLVNNSELYQKGSQSCNQFPEFLPFTSYIAFFIASSASIEQCSFTGGNFKYFAMSEFLILSASSTFIPLMTSVAQELEAMAEPQPKVLKTAFQIVSPSSLSSICSFITSPQAGAPTNPVPTFFLVLSREPTFLGFQQWSITLSWQQARRGKEKAVPLVIIIPVILLNISYINNMTQQLSLMRFLNKRVKQKMLILFQVPFIKIF